jgi:rod shape-determining protein MreC
MARAWFMHRSTPSLFKQGHSALARLVIFTCLALSFMWADARLGWMQPVRSVLHEVLYPLQVIALLPRDIAVGVADHVYTHNTLQRRIQTLETEYRNAAVQQQRLTFIEQENKRLRNLLSLQKAAQLKTLAAEIQYDVRYPYSQKLILDRGHAHGVKAGLAVVNERGLLGQITRIYPQQSELTLVTDREQSIPVQVVRTGLRTVTSGSSRAGLLELRYLPASADVQRGDILVTSGLDGLYPPGLLVGRIQDVDRKGDSAFARVHAQPLAGVQEDRQVLIVLNEPLPHARPDSPNTNERPTRNRRNRERNNDSTTGSHP